MQEQDTGTQLLQRLSSLRLPVDDRLQNALRDDVWNYVDDRRKAGWPPERVIIAVKQIAREAGVKPSSFMTRPNATLTTRDALLVEIVGWCIHRYYQHD